jgi:hypothetical protein
MTQPEYWAAVGDNEWMQEAACIKGKADPKIFDTVVNTNDPRMPEFLYEKQAMSYCNKCPVSMECLLYAKRYMKGYTGIVGRSRLVNGRIKEERNGARRI